MYFWERCRETGLSLKHEPAGTSKQQITHWQKDTHSSVLLDYGFIRSKMNESGVVTRAKCPLIRMRKMTEEESNYYLEKKAMDEGSIKREIVQGIINLFT